MAERPHESIPTNELVEEILSRFDAALVVVDRRENTYTSFPNYGNVSHHRAWLKGGSDDLKALLGVFGDNKEACGGS